MTEQEFKETIEKRLRGAEIVSKIKRTYDDIFLADVYYKNKLFSIDNERPDRKKFNVSCHSTKDYYEGIKVDNILNAMSKEEAEEITKKIRDTATKLPKKSLKLENNVENFINEIFK